MATEKTTKTRKGTAAPKTATTGSEPAEGALAAAKPRGASAEAERLIDGGTQAELNRLGAALHDERPTTATQAARVVAEISQRKPETLTPIVERLVAAIPSDRKRVAQSAAEALPAIAAVAPARVAKHLEKLKAAYPKSTEVGQDGLVRTFAALCAASVAYQKRLEPVLKQALAGADPKTLPKWTQIVLPSLKGEPHANARAVVERRLHALPKAPAQKIAEFLGIKLLRRR